MLGRRTLTVEGLESNTGDAIAGGWGSTRDEGIRRVCCSMVASARERRRCCLLGRLT